jgi:oligogalacturonide lyase
MVVQRYTEMKVDLIRDKAERRLGHTDHLMMVIIDFDDGPQNEPDPSHAHPHEHPHYNLFRMNLDSGEITQITDEPEETTGGESHAGPVQSVTKTPDSEIIVYKTGDKIRKLDSRSGEAITLYQASSYNLGAPSIARNRRYVGFCRNEDVHVADGPNYTGFKERFYRVKDGRITLAYLDGSGWFDVFKDTHQVGHFQFCPDDSTLGSYCHEGPWNPTGKHGCPAESRTRLE